MPRFVPGLIEKKVFISPSQEEALEAIAGWDDAYQAAAIDDTPSQPENAENSQISPEVAVETTSRDVSSPRNARDAALKEDSYNENFESDRSQSPSKTLSWSLAAAAAEHGGCSKDPKSPTSVTAPAEEEMEKSPLKGEVISEVEVSNRPREPPEAAVTRSLRAELQVVHQDAPRAELDVEERSGGREAFAVDKSNCCTHVVKTTAEVGARPPVSSVGVRVVGSSSVGDVPAFGSGSGSSSMSFRRNGQDSQPALPAENHIRFGFEGGTFVRSANDCIDQMTISGQANLQVLDNMVVEEDHSENRTKMGNDSERMRSRVQHEVNSLEKVRERGVRVETNTIFSTGLHDELETNAGLRRQDGPRVKVLSRKEKSNERSCSRTSSRPVIDASKVQSMQNAGVGVTPEDCSPQSQHSTSSPPSPPRPPRAVQEKLEKLRSQSGNKRAHSGGLDLIADRLRTGDFSFSSALEAIRIRSGERPADEVTAADLLKTALDVGIPLPPPFHKNYFSR